MILFDGLGLLQGSKSLSNNLSLHNLRRANKKIIEIKSNTLRRTSFILHSNLKCNRMDCIHSITKKSFKNNRIGDV